jgi:hypothetical protein
MKGTAILYEDNHVITCLENIQFSEVKKYTHNQTDETYAIPQLTMWHPEEIDWDYGY